MNDTARRQLRRAKIARLGTVSVKGMPNLTPLWFIFDGKRLYMNTREESVAVRNLTANPEVVALVEDERRRLIRIRGKARFTKEAPVTRRTAFKAAHKYMLSPGGLADFVSSLGTLPARVRYYAERGGESGTIVVTPETIEVLDRPHAT